jgi:hypothetical protein
MDYTEMYQKKNGKKRAAQTNANLQQKFYHTKQYCKRNFGTKPISTANLQGDTSSPSTFQPYLP